MATACGALCRNGELRLGREAIELFVEASGGSAMARYQMATALFEWGLLGEANEVLLALPEDQPDPIANAYSRGVMASYLGRQDEARTLLARVVAERPQSGTAWGALAGMTDFAVRHELAERLEQAVAASPSALPAERAAIQYALGKAHADRGDAAAAFAAFARGAQEMRSIARYDRAADAAHAVRATEGFTAERIAQVAARQGEPTGRTIFVAGAARSGSTLVQQILTAHGEVSGGAEFNRLALLASEVGGQSHAAVAAYVERAGAASAARLWQHWLDERFEGAGRIVDKSLDASRNLGVAASLLPDAPIIWTTRDPLDRAWSSFSTIFHGCALSWSYDLRDMAAQFRLEDKLLARWREILGDRILVVPYEGLVTKPDDWVRRILAHCGLGEEPQAFTPHTNRSAVITASTIQVRRPINTASIGAAAPYREFLRPFIEGYYGDQAEAVAGSLTSPSSMPSQ